MRQMLNGYIAHINERNERERLDGLYNNACAAMQQSATEEAYKNAASLFAVIKGHKDADNLQAECLRKAEQARLEAERKAAEEKAAAAEQAKKTKKIAMIAAPIVVVAIVAAVLISNFVKAQQEEAARLEAYNAAVALAEAGQYNEAIAAFTELGDYKDSAEQISETTYNQAVALFEAGKYDKAISIFTELGNYKDSVEQIANIQNQQLEEQYQAAVALLENGEYEKARDEFTLLGDYKDSTVKLTETITEMNYQQAVSLMLNGKYSSAFEVLSEIKDYKDSAERFQECIVRGAPFDYLREHKDEFKLLTGEEITTVFTGTWNVSDYEYKTFTFLDNGTIETKMFRNGKLVSRDWSIQGNTITIGSNSGITVSEVYDDGLILYNEEGKVYMRMWK